MASKRKVAQDDLRKLMADMKSNPGKPSATNKKLKLYSKELALIEEEKRQKSLRDQEKIRLKQEKLARIVPNQGLQPKKSILKSSGSVSNYNPYYQSKSNLQISSTTPKQAQSKKSEAGALPEGFFDDPKINKETKSINDVKTSSKVVEENIPDEEAGTLPKGFFDDPKLDAKARNVEYVDRNEEEWEKFQKEIGDEVATAQEILVEDRNEATADRQLEDIDEQIEAWKRVAQLEEKKEAIVKSKVKNDKEDVEDSESDSDV